MKKLLMSLIFIGSLCSFMAPQERPIEETKNMAVEIAINDFCQSKISKNHDVFYVLFHNKCKYDKHEIDDDLITISIGPINPEFSRYHITLIDTLGSKRLPTRYIIKDGKFFCWRDSEYGLTKEIVSAFHQYNLADSVRIADISLLLGVDSYINDKARGVDYYFCKNDISRYKRVITNIAAGWYAPPKLKCR